MNPKTLVALECEQIANENNATREVFCYKLRKQKQDNQGNNSESTDKNWSIQY